MMISLKSVALIPFMAPMLSYAAVSSDTVAALAARCSPDVSPLTMSYIVKAESGNNPYAININNGPQLTSQPQSEAEAVAVARKLLSENKNLDFGLAQINSANLKGLNLDLEHIFKPCVNLAASQEILKACYHESLKSWEPGQEALRHTLSCYNTGSQLRGFSTGYVQRVESIAANATGVKIPTLQPESEVQAAVKKASSYDGEPDAFQDQNERDSPDAFSQKNTDAFLTDSAGKSKN